MINDIHTPLDDYANTFKDAHAKNTSDFFEKLVHQSGIDEEANRRTVKELHTLQDTKLHENKKTTQATILLVGAATLTISITFYFYKIQLWGAMAAALAIGGLAIHKLHSTIKSTKKNIECIDAKHKEKMTEAWCQMQPLNKLYTWGIAPKLIQETTQTLAFDPYFSIDRLNELQNTFGLKDESQPNRSVTFSHSGTLNGNPFIAMQTLDHYMGETSYEGSLDISWTEFVRGTDGKSRLETRNQTLHASITKPSPNFERRTFIVYGNEAAPDLKFDRAPSKLSSLKDGFLSRWRKKIAIRRLESKARSKNAESGFTVMSNKEFDALFGASNRTHEIQFRLMFTPLAQQETLKILKDHKIGYGDNFSFTKDGKINIIEPEHLSNIDIGMKPEDFYSHDITQARQNFNRYHTELFRSIYFGISPLLAIPLYQQHHTQNQEQESLPHSQSCYIEHESIANYFGETTFQHPDCATRSILKTRIKTAHQGVQIIYVTAFGFRMEHRVSYVSKRGGDGSTHDVPVKWIEYIPVEKTSKIALAERNPHNSASITEQSDADANLTLQLKKLGANEKSIILRRSIFAATLPN